MGAHWFQHQIKVLTPLRCLMMLMVALMAGLKKYPLVAAEIAIEVIKAEEAVQQEAKGSGKAQIGSKGGDTQRVQSQACALLWAVTKNLHWTVNCVLRSTEWHEFDTYVSYRSQIHDAARRSSRELHPRLTVALCDIL